MKAKVYDHTGKNTSTIELPAAIFAVKVSSQLLAQYTRVYLSRQRQATSQAKTRGEIALTKAKVWRQKGTGRARHGARSAPIFVGGGVSHGPTGDQNYQLKLSKKMRRQALLGALTSRADILTIITGLDKLSTQTKSFQTLITKITGDTHKTLVILDQPFTSVIQAAQNIKFITLTQAKRLNAYEILNHRHLIMSQACLKLLAHPDTSTTTSVAATSSIPSKTTTPKKAPTKIKKTTK